MKLSCWIVVAGFLLLLFRGPCCAANAIQPSFPVSSKIYQEAEAGRDLSLSEKLFNRARAIPFNLVATIFFLGAIIHTFLAAKFTKIAERFRAKGEKLSPKRYFLYTIFHFLGEVEAVFGIWALPLMAVMGANFGWRAVENYFNNILSFSEPIFVVVIMTIAATKPILLLSESILRKIANIGGGTVGAWWITVLIFAPLLGSLVTEPVAMTIGALLLAKKFYPLKPSKRLSYATLGLLFANVSVGGVLAHFAAPPVLMVAHKWHLTMGKVFVMLGQHAIAGVIAGTAIYYGIFRAEFRSLQNKFASLREGGESTDRNAYVTIVHCLFLFWTIINLHTPALVVAGFLLFLAFVKATKIFQSDVELRSPIMVGFFLAGLVVHGGLQEWWIGPVLSNLKEFSLFLGATVLTSFNDNAAITYLASLVPEFATNAALQKAVLSGAVAGGGLTVIANAPNPAGQNILSKYFKGGISPLYLFLGAILPVIIVSLCFNCW